MAEISNQARFIDTLAWVQEELCRREIDFRIIGSLAFSAYLEPAEECSLDFDRGDVSTPTGHVPDIDVILPRQSLPEARHVRRRLNKGDFPVKLGLALSAAEFDFRPDEPLSHLSHANIQVPVASQLLGPVEQRLLGVPITTVDPRTLLHTLGINGHMRPKDFDEAARLRAALERGDISSRYDEAEYGGFSTYKELRRRNHAPQDIAQHLAWAVIARLSPAAQNRAYRFGVALAGVFGLR